MRAGVCGLLVLAVALLTENAGAQSNDPDSANHLLPACRQFIADKSSASVFMLGVCARTIEGLRYMASLLPQEKRACPPPSVTNGQVVRVVVAYIERRPQRMHENFKELTLEALHDAWPCR